MIRLLDAAKEDLRGGWRFYEKQSEGLGDYFLASLQTDIESLSVYAGVHEVIEGFHRMLSKRFPFAVYYLVGPASIDVYAVLDCRRDPDWIVKRLSST